MGLRISTNVAALATNRILAHSKEELTKTYQKLASGQRITSSGDDAAGLSISENLRAQIRSMAQAERNANDGISFVQVAEGGLTETGNILIRLRELAIQAASDTIGDRERGFINGEVQSLVKEVDRIANATEFNGVPLLNGKAPQSTMEIQVGIRNTTDDRIAIETSKLDARADTLGVSGLSYESISDARDALEKVDSAMEKLFSIRAQTGATQNKLQSTVRNIAVAKENLEIARSRIADADIAFETSELVRQSILQSAGVAVLSQANSTPQLALKLLGTS